MELLPTAHLALDREIIVNDTITIVYLHNVDIWDQHSSTAARHLQERMTSRHDAWHKYTNTKYRKYWVLTGHLPAGAAEQQLDVVKDLLGSVKSDF